MDGRQDEIRRKKRRLRKRVLGLRDALDGTYRTDASRSIVERVLGLREMETARTVHLFASFGSEVDTLPLIEEILRTGRRPVLPIVVSDRWTMEHATIRSTGELRPGFRGIPEPLGGCARVEPSDLDLVIAPGVAFDRTGGRLGYGGGFYDAFLPLCRAPRVAIAFELQVVDEVPCDDCDLPVDVIVTEREVIRSRR